MTVYTVNFEYETTLWDHVDVTADDVGEAEELAQKEIEMAFPEARNVIISDIVEAI